MTTTQTKARKLLILRGPALEAQGILELLGEQFDLRMACDLEEALAAMRAEPFDAVLAETADFLPLERGAVTQQAAAILDTVGDGVCIVGQGGQLAWANRRIREAPAALLAELRHLCASVFEDLALRPGGGAPARRSSLTLEGGDYYEVFCSPIRDREGLLRQVVAVVVNATHQRRQQQKLNALDRAGRELASLERSTIARCDAHQRLQLLAQRIIGCSREVLHYQHFAVLLLNEQTNRLEVVIAEGLDEEAWKYELLASPEGSGICGYVAATGRSYICPDVRQDKRYLPGLRGARSSLTVPLRMLDRVIGVLNVESDQARAFGEEDRQFAEIFANYVAVAMNVLNLLATERHATHTEISGSISAELAGPINDIITAASELMEEYIGHDELRKGLGEIIDRATRARQSLRQLSHAGVAGAMGAAATAEPKTDPLLSGRRVLVADDEEAMRETIRDVLGRYGCRVELASNGQEAVELLGQRDYDLVISDIKMPRASGYQVFAAAKSRRPGTPVVLITAFGYDPKHAIFQARQEGLEAVLLKPFKVDRLLEVCRTALSGAGKTP